MNRRLWSPLPGVDAGTWDYLNSSWIAERYESYFADHPLFAVDQDILLSAFGPASHEKTIVDLGCGNGRALLPLVQKGFAGLAVDLSPSMLREVRDRAKRMEVEVPCVHANLVQLEGLSDASCDHGMCLFSTLGMIHGREHRTTALRHFRRIIKPNGTLVLHVHNYWYNLFDPGGPWWLFGNLIASGWSQTFGNGKLERGDKHYPYRGLQNMFLHVFPRGEIQASLQAAGWTNLEFIPLRPVSLQPWHEPAWFKSIRTVGWVIVCRS
ncbi:MAG: class I SAM-dependent methyltransferase [Planctomycetaceae bacterium]|jgi:ubiquinone/menaquinone biosynthesis C-methylase UbiE|nr:class I SAM-dependent methyltransferase [Planctomycetaceae bacterium]